MALSSSQTQRRKLGFFAVLSIFLHLLLLAAFVVPELNRRAEQLEHVAQAAREKARQEAQRAEDSTKAQQRIQQIAATQAAGETQRVISSALHDEFSAVVGEQVKSEDAAQLWDEILAELNAPLDDYSREVSDGQESDVELAKGLDSLQAKMLRALADRLKQRSRQQLADAFVMRVREQVSPKLLEYYRRQLELKIGNALRDEGSKLVRDHAAQARGKRQAINQALADAERQARSAASDLEASKKRLAAARMSADALRDSGKADAADHKLVDAALAEKANIGRGVKAIELAGQKLTDTAVKGDGLGDVALSAIHAAADAVPPAAEQAHKALDGANGGEKELLATVTDAAEKAAKLGDAVRAAHDATGRENVDPAVEARLALKDARDDDLKALIEKAFWDNYARSAAPRLGDKLAGAYRQTLEEDGIKDEANVAEVRVRVRAALVDAVHDKLHAGDVATDPLSKAEHLDDGALAKADGPHGKAIHGSAIADKIHQKAVDLIGAGVDGIGQDAAGDEAAVRAARGDAAKKHGKGDDADESDPGGLAGLAARVGRLADNVSAGRTDLTDAALAGANGTGNGGAAGANSGGFAPASAMARLRKSVFERSHGVILRNHGRFVNEAQYAALTVGIHERDREMARGEATTRRSAEGNAVITTTPIETPVLQPAAVLVPAEPKTAPMGQADPSQPFRPQFKSIRFAAIPYRSVPVTIDGDLSEWKDVPELPMTPAIYGPKDKPELKRFPQAVKVQWDNTGFFLAFNVKDADDKISRAEPGNFWEADGIEFWVDTLNTKEKFRTQCTHQFWAWVEPSAKDPSQVGGEAQSWPGRDTFIGLGSDAIKTASKHTPGGWSIEVFVPAARFRMLELQPGRMLGMNFSICTGTDLYYYWAGTTEVATARRPDTWGDALLAGSAGKLECLDKLATELKLGETARPIEAVHIGDPLRIRVSDADMNLSDGARDRISVNVSTGRGERESVVLEETGNSTGVFEGILRTVPDTGATSPGVLRLLDGDKIDIIYNDQCRPDGARNVRVKLTVPTASAITGQR